MDKPTNAPSWGRKPAASTKLIELTHRLFAPPCRWSSCSICAAERPLDDPARAAGFATTRPVVLFDNAGVAASGGEGPRLAGRRWPRRRLPPTKRAGSPVTRSASMVARSSEHSQPALDQIDVEFDGFIDWKSSRTPASSIFEMENHRGRRDTNTRGSRP